MNSSQDKSISIIGCGWLGQALYKELKRFDYSVRTLSRSSEHSNDHVKFELGRDEINYGELGQTVVFTLPPRAVFDCYGAFKNFIRNMPPEKHLIYTSSTSVFGSKQGLCTEKIPPNPDNDRGRRQKELEDFITTTNEMATIVRAGGLIGKDRFPSFPSGYIFTETDMVNLIDKEDIVSIFCKIIEERIRPSLVHAVAPFHPLKKDYYPQPEDTVLTKANTNGGKMIFSNYLTQINYSFKNPSLKHPRAAKEHRK